MSCWEPEPIPPLRAAIIAQILGGLIAIGLVALVFLRILRSGEATLAFLLGAG